ncbi:MAG TPA: addiction module protein [Burkholderiales bacterium]|nr:addiction module protein [Burkholderiales bacterium]
MTETTKNLSNAARKLSPTERLELVDDLLASLHESDPKLDAQWAKEAEDRLVAYRRGERSRPSRCKRCWRSIAWREHPAPRDRTAGAGRGSRALQRGDSAGLGDAFVLETISAFEQIRRFPEPWQPLGAGMRRCRVRRFPYGLIFAKDERDILILAVAHTHREPDYWRTRVGSGGSSRE